MKAGKGVICKMFIVILVLFVLPMATMAEIVEVDGIWYVLSSADEGTAEVTHHPDDNVKYEGSISIPGIIVYDNVTYTVTRIGCQSFWRCMNLDVVTIPNSVTSIATYAFSESRINTLILGNGLTEIERCAFSVNIENLYISDVAFWCDIHFVDNQSNPFSQSQNNFLDGEKLQHLVIPEDITNVPDYAFYGCKDLQSVELPSTLKTIGREAFKRCTSLGEVVFPDNLIHLGDYAFQGCSAVTSVSFGNGLKSMKDNTFLDCTGITYVHISDLAAWCKFEYQQTTYSPHGFLRGRHLMLKGEEVIDLVIPEGVTAIADYAFAECEYLNSVVVANDVQTIGNCAFGGCHAVKSLTIGNHVTVVGDGAFGDCSITEVAIPLSVTSIGDGAFACSTLTKVIIPDNVTSLGRGAFEGCRQLKAVTISNSIDDVNAETFYGCENLSTINWGSKIKSIGEKAFCRCTSLTNVDIPTGVQTILGGAFRNCEKIEKVIIPGTVYFIGSAAFAECKTLRDICCWSATVPQTHQDTFYNTNVYQATLYVPEIALTDYENTDPWMCFGQIKPLEDSADIEDVTYSMSPSKGNWFSTDGIRLSQKPVKKGVYIQNGRKIVVR